MKINYILTWVISLMCIFHVSAYAENSDQQKINTPTSKLSLNKTDELNIVKNKEDLQKRLNIPKKRVEEIIIGTKGVSNINKFIANSAGEVGYTCTSHGCSCHGDDDCNLMFTQVCADPNINASCTGDVCACTP